MLYCWEIGDGLGHIVRFAPIADALRRRGVELSFAICDLAHASQLKLRAAERLYQAPSFSGRGLVQRLNCTYPQLLFNHGFADASILEPRIRAWRQLLTQDEPDAVVCDLAPAAQLAAQMLKIPTVLFGDGFGCPPAKCPMPFYLNTNERSAKEAIQDEQRVNSTIGAVCDSYTFAQTTTVQGILDGSRRVVLTTYPELDPYGPRDLASYVGIWASAHITGSASNPSLAEEIEVFCYLKYQPGIEFVIGCLNLLNCPCTAYIQGAPVDFVDFFSTPKIRIVTSPVNLHEVVARGVRIAITHGNHGTTSFLLAHGIPVIMLPSHAEQWAHSLMVQKANLGRIAELGKPASFPKTLADVWLSDSLRSMLAQFASRTKEMGNPIENTSNQIMEAIR